MTITITSAGNLRLSFDAARGQWSAAGPGQWLTEVAAALNASPPPEAGPHDTAADLALRAVAAFGFTGLTATVEGVDTGEAPGEDNFTGPPA